MPLGLSGVPMGIHLMGMLIGLMPAPHGLLESTLSQTTMAPMAQRKEAPMKPVPTQPARGLPSFLPQNMRMTNAASGSSVAMIRSSAGVGMICRLALQVSGAFHINGREVVVEIQEDRESNRSFGGGENDHKYRKHLTGEKWTGAGAGVGIAIERNQIHIRGVED